MSQINIICSHQFNNILKTIPHYKMDLGKSYTKKNPIKNELMSDIKDPFVSYFFNLSSKLIYKVAVLGSLSIYTYSSMDDDNVIIFNGEKNIEKKVNLSEAENNIEKSLALLLMEIA